jgi:hypothetical protein
MLNIAVPGRALLVIAALAAFAWTFGVWLSGGLTFSLAQIRFSSSDPLRPLVIGIVGLVGYMAVSGPTLVRRDAGVAARALRPGYVAALVAIALFAISLAHNSWTGGGSDSFSYISQADLWLAGDLKVPVPLARDAPWPVALETFAPMGYRPAATGGAIVPVTSPGLPLLMAVFKGVGGHAAAFLVAPASGALLVWVTFLIGRRLGSDRIGLGGAWLLATSPTLLMMVKSPMSDVPASLFWALAVYWTLGTTARSAIAAGLAASAAVLVRPNLVPLAAILFAWMLFRTWNRSWLLSSGGSSPIGAPGAAIRHASLFALATLPGCVAVAAINQWLHGSPLSSGYGELNDLFSTRYIPATLAHYAQWILETQTPLVAAGAIVLAIAPSRLWLTPAARAGARLLAAVVVAVWALYAAYPSFDAWWFLRFLLPSWPAICLGTAAFVVWVFNRRTRWDAALQAAALLAIGAITLTIAVQRGVFPDDEGDRRYAAVAQLVRQQTGEDAVILAAIHAGSTRYYGGRTTMRFDLLDEAWLDRSVDWLRERGRHPYVLIEDWEMPGFTKRFASRNGLAGLTFAPVLAYRGYRVPGTIYLFDLLRPDGPTFEPPPIPNPRPRCLLPAGSPIL